ncbi:MAG: type I DNA topoisomerase [Candidatus Jorgensenbacteria bacterium]|nr:type I DNA topoisomerase [Candidatus Jorgensenbacteria bacterium]
MKLVIVESPTKAKTISHYLDSSFKVMASVGHIRDLPKKNSGAIDIAHGFVPHYEVVKGKEKIVAEIKQLSKKASEVYLTTDPDREGEAIAWHIKEACGLKDPKRAVVHEITKEAVMEALAHPRHIDEDLRKAQEARRVLDRLFGYDLSGLIWKKVRYGLSAGRVQSPALRILMEREREIRAFVPEDFWVITGEFNTEKNSTITLVCDETPAKETEAERIIAAAKKNPWHVIEVKQTEAKRSPRPPFITSTLQQAASSELGFAPSRTMRIAQHLFENGLITYMRTDSTNLSAAALAEIYGEIEKTYGKQYLSPRAYHTKSKTAQEAHEAIRPTSARKRHAGSGEAERLYNMILERTVASQMADAKTLRTKISANIIGKGDAIPNFSVNGSVIVFPGWFAADPGARGEETELPKIMENDPLTLKNIASEGKQTEPPGRYTEAGLIKELEKREIGRPSTYASIIQTLLTRAYVLKNGRALQPTDVGEVVSTFLEKNFEKYISDSFTADMENKLDLIADGKENYVTTLKNFYTPFSKDVAAKAKIEKLTTLGEADKKFKCPVCGSSMDIKLGRSGKFLSCSRFPKCKGSLKIDGAPFEEPKETGEMCPECKTGKLVEREGKFGKFIACNNYPKCKYIKEDPAEVAKRKTGVTCPLCKEGEITERRGRFGFFYSCSNYPKCKFAMKARPTGNICKLCDSLMMEGTKTIPERCSNKDCPNHNPLKAAKRK